MHYSFLDGGGGGGRCEGALKGMWSNEMWMFRYGAGEIGTQKPGKKTEAVIAVLEGEGEEKGEAEREEGK